jgi:glycosyltransferase involved in cell wall biosynthesis
MFRWPLHKNINLLQEISMDTSKISIIIPVYNSEKYLARCINSILSQTFEDFECLLIDDCSADNSLEICNHFKRIDNRIKVYSKQQNEGTAQARKTGVFHAVGEYTIFVDNDDWIEPTMLEELYTKIKSENYDMVCCDYYIDDSHKTEYRKQNIENKTYLELIREIIACTDFMPVTWNKLVKTEIYQKTSFPKTIFSEDRAIMSQVLYYCKTIGYVNKAFYHWCLIPTSASNCGQRFIKNLIDDYISYTTILLFVIDIGIDTDKFIKEIINHINIMGFYCCNNKKILDEYKKSINKIAKLKMENKLTEISLLSEQKNIEKIILKLNKRYYRRIIKCAVNRIKETIPQSIKEKIKKY